MSVADILPPSGLKRFVESYLDVVAVGLRRLRKGSAAHSGALFVMLLKLLRYALVILACHCTLAPVKARGRRAARVKPEGVRGLSFPLFPLSLRLVEIEDPPDPAPAALAPDHRDSGRDRDGAAQRRLDMLARVLANPAAYARRMARRLPAQLMVMGVGPARRPPSAEARDTWETLVDAWREAWHHLHEFRRRTRDSAGLGTSAS